MKNISLITILFLIICSFLFADDFATTDTGRKVLLKDDGTWEYIEEAIGNKGKWEIKTEIDPLTDNKRIIFLLRADSGGSSISPIGLVIRYYQNDTELFVSWGDYLGDNNKVLIRFDEEKLYTEFWSLSTSKTALFRRKPNDFIEKILNHNKLVMQTTPYNEGPVTAIFDIRGLKEASKTYNDDLKWY